MSNSNYPKENVLILKTGSTAIFQMQYTDDANPPNPKSIAGYEISMDFIDPKTKELLVATQLGNGITSREPLEGTGLYTVNAGDTSKWPVCKMSIDIKYTFDNVVQHTETFIIEIVKGISQSAAPATP